MTERKLRSNFEPGTTRESVRRAQWKALGLSEADLTRPKIAVVNSSSELAICFSHLDGVAKVVKDAVRAAGGLPFEVRTAAPSDFIISAGGSGYILASRDLVVNDIEIAVQGAQLDGMVCLTSCDKTPPAHLMAAGRFNIPTILVVCGYQQSGEYRGKHVDIEDVFLGSVQAQFGKLDRAELTEMSNNAIRGPGVCSGMATANSMHVVVEALGMSLPGGAPVAANSEAMFDCARRAGERIVGMVWEDLKPRSILTPGAIRNAVAAVLAVSGSINCIKHLQATAVEAGVDVDVFALFNELGSRVPVLSAVRPNGDDSIEAFDAAGGARALLKQLSSLLDLDALTVTGKTLRENLATAQVHDAEVIRPLSRPFSDEAADRGAERVRSRPTAPSSSSAFAIRAARTGSRVRRSCSTTASTRSRRSRRGRCKQATCSSCGAWGRRAAPAWPVPRRPSCSRCTPRICRTTWRSCPTVSSPAFATRDSPWPRCRPKRQPAGPLGLVENGDTITIDVDRQSIDLEVAAEALAARRARLGTKPLKAATGWLSIYREQVQPMSSGVVLVKNR